MWFVMAKAPTLGFLSRMTVWWSAPAGRRPRKAVGRPNREPPPSLVPAASSPRHRRRAAARASLRSGGPRVSPYFALECRSPPERRAAATTPAAAGARRRLRAGAVRAVYNAQVQPAGPPPMTATSHSTSSIIVGAARVGAARPARRAVTKRDGTARACLRSGRDGGPKAWVPLRHKSASSLAMRASPIE